MGTPSPKNLLLGAGQVFFDRFDADGNRTGLRHLGNVPKCDLNTTVDKVQKKSSMNAARSIYAEAVRETKVTTDLTVEEFDPPNLALALLGEEGVIIQAAGSVTDKRVTAYKGRYISVGDFNISGVTVKPTAATTATIAPAVAAGTITSDGTVTSSGTYTGTDAADYYIVITAANTAAGAIAGTKFQWKKGLSGVLSSELSASAAASAIDNGVKVLLELTGGQNFVVGDTWKIAAMPALTEYIAGVDFVTDAVLSRGGLISIPDTSRIADATEVFVGYTKPAATYPKVAGATATNIEGYMLFLGDPSKGPAYNAEFWHVSITPSGAIPLIGDDFAGFDMSVTVLEDRQNHPTEPYHRLVKLK